MDARRRPDQNYPQCLRATSRSLSSRFSASRSRASSRSLNHLVGPKKPKVATAASRRQGEPYESGIPVEAMKGFKFGVSFYLVAMLFILFDIEVVFLYPVGVILKGADSVFVLGELITFVVLLMIAFVYVWRKGALDWK